jgi:hypothetical protein
LICCWQKHHTLKALPTMPEWKILF